MANYDKYPDCESDCYVDYDNPLGYGHNPSVTPEHDLEPRAGGEVAEAWRPLTDETHSDPSRP